MADTFGSLRLFVIYPTYCCACKYIRRGGAFHAFAATKHTQPPKLPHLDNHPTSSFRAASNPVSSGSLPPLFSTIKLAPVSVPCDPPRAGQKESCGTCGGSGCSDRSGGDASCCSSAILASDRKCYEVKEAPCVMVYDAFGSSSSSVTVPLTGSGSSSTTVTVP